MAACPAPPGQAPKTYEVQWVNPYSGAFNNIYTGDSFSVKWSRGLHNVFPLSNGVGLVNSGQLQACTTPASSGTCNFNIPSSYSCNDVIDLYCTEHPNSMLLRIGLGGSSNVEAPTVTDPNMYRYAHGSLMFIAFGIVLPVGGFLAQSGRIKYHRICQTTGIICGITGYLTIAAGIGSGSHFNYPHSIVGMLLVLLAFVFQPLAVWLGLQTSIPELKDFRSFFRSLHRRNGQMLVFFGIANIFLGFLALDTVNASPNYTQNLKIAYGIVVGIMIMAYMLFQPNTATFKRGDARAKWDAFAPQKGTDDTSDPLAKQAQTAAKKPIKGDRSESEMESLVPGTEVSAGAAVVVDPERSVKPEMDDALLQSILASSQDAIIGGDGAGNITSWNDAARNMFGYTKDEAIGQSLQILMPRDYRNRHQAALDAQTAESAKAGGKKPGVKKYDKIYAVRGVAKNGTEFPIEVSVTSFMLGGKMRYNSIIRDLSGTADQAGSFVPEHSQENLDIATAANQLLKQKALKLGAMMQTAHGLSSSAFITKQELAHVINKGMVEAKLEANSELRKQKCESVAAAIMHDAARGVEDKIFFLDLIPMLLKRGITVTDQGALQLQNPRTRRAERSRFEVFVRYFKVNKQQIGWMLGLFAINLTLFLTAFFEFRGKGANEWIQVARGGGRMLNFDCAIIVLPMCRKAMGYLRTTIMRKFTPFDESIEFHKVIAYYILFATVLHTIAHFGNYLTPTMSACPPALAFKYLNFTSQGGVGTGDCNFSFWLFGTQPGLTGFVLLLIMIFIYGGANETIRRGSDAQRSAPPPAQTGDRSGSTAKAPVKTLSAAASNPNWRQIYSHSVFFFTHHLFVVFFLLILIHGYGLEADIGNPNFYKYFLACGPIYFIERFVRDGLAKREDLRVLKAVPLPGKVTALYVQKPKIWDVKAGMYLFIQIPEISSFEWHPFTITSAPEDPWVSVHIKALGDWTNDLFKLFKDHPVDVLSPGNEEANHMKLPIARIDGPYGAPTQDVFRFETAVVVGAGIGATPSVSVLRHVLYRLKDNAGCRRANCTCTCSCCLFKIKKLYFIWSNRDAEAFQWFSNVLGAVEVHPSVEIRAFLTSSGLGKDDLNAFLLRIGMEALADEGRSDVVSNLKSATQFRRPDFNEIFRELSQKHPAEKVGVFFCGPSILGESIRQACDLIENENLGGTKTQFSFNMEVF